MNIDDSDGFDSFDQEDFLDFLEEDTFESSTSQSVPQLVPHASNKSFHTKCTGGHAKHMLIEFVDDIVKCCPKEKWPTLVLLIKYVIFVVVGKRNLKKKAIKLEELSEEKQFRARQLRRKLKPTQMERMYELSQNWSGRIQEFFVVTYALFKCVCYWIDTTTYPYKIVGKVGIKHQEEIEQLVASGRQLKFINVYQRYDNFKKRNPHNHAPYARGDLILFPDGFLLRSCKDNFLQFFDSICGLEYCNMFESDIRSAYMKRHNGDPEWNVEATFIMTSTGMMRPVKKRKTVLNKHTDGQNFGSRYSFSSNLVGFEGCAELKSH